MCRATMLCCFRCVNWFDKTDLTPCETCGDWECPRCGACLCALSKKERKIALSYMATYENLLREMTGESYDFRKHGKVLESIHVNRRRLVRGDKHD